MTATASGITVAGRRADCARLLHARHHSLELQRKGEAFPLSAASRPPAGTEELLPIDQPSWIDRRSGGSGRSLCPPNPAGSRAYPRMLVLAPGRPGRGFASIAMRVRNGVTYRRRERLVPASEEPDSTGVVAGTRCRVGTRRGTVVAMTTEALRTVKDRFSEYVDRVERQHERVVVTRNGRPAIVLISTEDLESLEETLAVLSDREVLAGLRESDDAVARGDVVRGVDAVRALRSHGQ